MNIQKGTNIKYAALKIKYPFMDYCLFVYLLFLESVFK